MAKLLKDKNSVHVVDDSNKTVAVVTDKTITIHLDGITPSGTSEKFGEGAGGATWPLKMKEILDISRHFTADKAAVAKAMKDVE